MTTPAHRKTAPAHRIIPLAALLWAALLPACVGYGTYPRAQGQSSASAINSAAAEEIIIAAFRHTLDRDAGSAFAEPSHVVLLSLPPEMPAYRARRIAEKLGPGVLNPTQARVDAGLPVYHVGRLAQRGDRAEIDIYRPVALGPDTPSSHQAITLRLRGGSGPWRVELSQPWAVGAFQPPPLSPLEDDAR